MTWIPANITDNCSNNPSSCQPAVLAFMAFLVQHFGHSNDKYFSEAKMNEEEYELEEDYDFIIVGAGSAGCVLANRLTEIEEWKVLLLEAGDEEPAITGVPAFNKFLRGSSTDWAYETEPQSNACRSSKDHRCAYPSGKVMGGSSSTNSMKYSRGSKYDYDNWAKLGNPGWSYEEVLYYFKKFEDHKDYDQILSERFEAHGKKRYLNIEKFPYTDKNGKFLIDAWKELGYKQIDYNSENQIGFDRGQHTNIHGARQSANGAFLRPIRGKRPNLVIKTNAPVTKVIIDPLSKAAVGVEISSFKNKKLLKKIYAKKEVIVSAGALNSPKLLMLSGIGKTEDLTELGIKVIKDLPVGDNFHDHVNLVPFTVIFDNNRSTLINISDVQNDVAYWMSTHDGPLSSLGSVSEVSGFMQTLYEKNPGVSDVLLLTLGTIVEEVMNNFNNFSAKPYPSAYYNAMDIQLKLLNIKSRGTIKLNRGDPTWGAPLIQPNYFSDSADLKAIVEAGLMAKQFLETRAFQTSNLKVYRDSMKDCKHFDINTVEYMKCAAVNYTRSGLHGVGSCKMGPEHDSGSVVDARLRIYGIRNLRVIDASIMPTVPRGYINAPTIMIAEKGSDIIKEDWLEK